MKEIIQRILEGKFNYDKNSLSFSCVSIEMLLKKAKQKEAFFTVECPSGKRTDGIIYSSDSRMSCTPDKFSGILDQVTYRYDASGLEEGDERKGSICIISNQGEYFIPFTVTIVQETIESTLGNIKNLFHFANLAKTNWEEAVRIFYSKDFKMIFQGNDKRYQSTYRGYSRYYGNEQNVEEFLMEIKKKQIIEYIPDQTEIRIEDLEESLEGELLIKRNGWGYTRLEAESEGGFLFVSKKVVTESDFKENCYYLPYYIDRNFIHAGKNYGKLFLKHAYGIETINFVVIKNGAGNYHAGKRFSSKKLTIQLMEAYQKFRLKRMNTAKWLEETKKTIEKLCLLDEKDKSAKLFQVQLLITEERYNEAKWILDRIDVQERKDSPELFCYFLYLKTLYNKDEIYVNEVTRQVQNIFAEQNSNWKIAWLLLYLSEELNRSIPQKWLFLENQFEHGCVSPVMYLEALHLINGNPTLLMKLGTAELQVLSYGLKMDALSPEIVEQLHYLADKEKQFKEPIYRVLVMCYAKTGNLQILHAICSLLIKGNRTDQKYFKWYQLGVSKELRITRLYEYYLMSADLESDLDIPKMVLMYFAYQSDLSYERNAFLYASMIRNREKFPELFETYQGQMERFAIKQIYEHRISRNLTYLYQYILENPRFSEEHANELINLLFMQLLTVSDKNIRNVIVVHRRVDGEATYPVMDGKAYLPLYGNEYTVLLEDVHGNRFMGRKDFKIEKFLFPGKITGSLEALIKGNLAFDLYLCEGSRELISITERTVERFFHIAERPEIVPDYRQAVRMKLLQYYYEQDQIMAMDQYLRGLDVSLAKNSERTDIVRYMALRGMYQEAYQVITQYGPEGIDPKTLVKVCSRILEKEGFLESAEMTWITFFAFKHDKYDANILQYLILFFNGMTRDMRDIWRAAKEFDIDSYEICEKIIFRILYTNAFVGEEFEIFKEYVRGGAKSDVEIAFLSYCAYEYLVKGRITDEYIFRDMMRVARRGETITKACRLAFMQYYAEHKELRDVETDELIIRFGEELIRENIVMPFFIDYVDLYHGMEQFIDKTMVEYIGHPDSKVTIHYVISKGQEVKPAYSKEEMKNMFEGIFVKPFILFFGETLQYYIIEEKGNKEQLTESGNIQKSDICKITTESRYSLLNDISIGKTLQDFETVDELLKEYMQLNYITECLFHPL